MKKYFLLSLKCLFLLALILGCSALQAKRAVNENTFVSSAPDLSIKVNPEFKYVGNAKDSDSHPNISGHDLRHQYDSFCFVSPDKDQAKKAIAIQIETTETYFVSDWYRNNINNVLDKGTIWENGV